MAALIGTAVRSVFSHIGRNKFVYGLGAGAVGIGGACLYTHQKRQEMEQMRAEQASPMPEMSSSPTDGYNTNPNQGPSYTA